MKKPDVRAVPLLPCRSLDEAVDVMTALGFAVTYRQSTPQPYVALRDDLGMEVHYFVVEELEPADSYGACLMAVQHPVDVFDRWVAGLTDYFGAVPTEGYPRLIRPKSESDEMVGFSFVDASGNRIRVVQDAEIDDEPQPKDLPTAAGGTPETPDASLEEPAVEPAPEPEPEPERESEPESEFVFGPPSAESAVLLPPPNAESAVLLPPPPGVTPEPDFDGDLLEAVGEPQQVDSEAEAVSDVLAEDERSEVDLPEVEQPEVEQPEGAPSNHRFAALIYLAELSTRLGRLDDARTHLETAEAIDPNSPALQAAKEALAEQESRSRGVIE